MDINQNIAYELLYEAEKLNPRLWVKHSIVARECARKIASKCDNLNPNKAFIYGLLHDIGRRNGVFDMIHIYHEYQYMLEKGYEDVGRICLTHLFPYKNIQAYTGQNDCGEEISNFITSYIKKLN